MRWATRYVQLGRQSPIPRAAPRHGRDRPDYGGKVTGAKFFARSMLPNLEATRTAIENIENDVMELSEEAF